MARVDSYKFYLNNLREHGVHAKALGWNSEQNQLTRFQIIYSFLREFDNFSIIDAGSGLGDFYKFLSQKNKTFNYLGLDIQIDFINIANSKYGNMFLYRDVLTDELFEADFYIASGSLNLLHSHETKEFIQNCFKNSKKGFIFNLLKKDKNHQNELFNYQNPNEIISFCKTLTKNIKYVEGYIKHDFTVGMFK